ncbi:hypothetical protein M9H77_29833 [Catharanthus roseus]|uniref:Uncharacterized protein n=1 Tax=Catharanthus roseus TaxID=4058 RepID=A0ACB9ZVW0_CATRO|nr:hypothetical protein M9H77_29833 [Catharanthus roseus]
MVQYFTSVLFIGKYYRRKRLALGILPDKPTGRKSAIKRTEPDLNPRESKNKTVSNSLEKEKVANRHLGREVLQMRGTQDKFIIPFQRLGRKKAQIRSPERRKEGLLDTCTM